ncbi:MAG: hypothetical protein ACRCXT_07580 [Paraclostridium sp.]
MERIVVESNSLILRVSNKFLMSNTKMKPSEYLLYLYIFRLIQIRESSNDKMELYIDKDSYYFTRKEISAIFNEQFYQKNQLNKIINGMMENQSEEILVNCDYDGSSLVVEFNHDIFCDYFMSKSNYTTLDLNDFIGIKNITHIKIMMLISRFSTFGWVKIKEDDIRLLLDKFDSDAIQTKTLTRDIKSSIRALSGKYEVFEFTSCSSKNEMQYEFKFKSFNYIYKNNY